MVVSFPQDMDEVVQKFNIASQEQFPRRIGAQSVDSFPQDDDARFSGEPERVIAWSEVAGVPGETDPMGAWLEGHWYHWRE